MLLSTSTAGIRPRTWRMSETLTGKEHRTDLDFGSGRNTSSCGYEQVQSFFPTDFPKDPSSAGQGEEGRGHVAEQKQRWRRSACIVDGGKEKEVGEMREALKRAKDKWLEEARNLEETRRKQQAEKKSWEIERESLLKDLEAKDRQIESLKTSLKLAREHIKSGHKSIVVLESRSTSVTDKGTQTSAEGSSVTPGNVVRPLMLKQSSTEIIRSLTAEKKTQLADEHAKMSELQDQLKDLQQRCDARAEVVKCINASPYWKTKEELEKLVQAQREHVFLTQEIKEKQLKKALKENQCEQMEEFCYSMENCVRFLEESRKQKAQQVELDKKRTLQRQQAMELDETVWQTASIVRQELSKEEWYWGPASKTVVQKVLAGMKMGSFLVRDSSSNIGTYILVVKLQDVEMIPIKADSRGWCLSDHSLHFASVVDLVMHYQKNSLKEVSTALDIALTYPIKRAECQLMILEANGSESPVINGHSRAKKEYFHLDRDGHVVADDLGSVDLSVLAKHIPSITPHWELVGHALDVGQTVLTIRGTEREPNSKCLCVLEAWVAAGKDVSWKKLFDVLQYLQLNDTVQRVRQSLQEEDLYI